MQRRYFGLATVGLAALALSSLAGCGSGTGDSNGVTLKLVAADYGASAETSSKRYWNDLADAFTLKHPNIKIDVNVISWNDIDKNVDAMIKRGEYPDVLQTGGYADFAARDMLYSADELLSIPVQADFITSLSDAGQVHRVQYGIPFVSSSRMLFYNAKLFQEAGIDGAPETWAQLKADAEKLKAAGVEMPYGLPLGPEEAQAESMMWLLGADGGYTDQVGSYTLDSNENIETFRWLKDNLVSTGLTGSNPAKTNRQQVFDKFLAGKVGMLNGHPTLIGQAKSKGIDYRLAPIPGKSNTLQETLGVADWMMAFKKNGHKKEAGEFLSFVYDQKNTVNFLEQYDLLPVTVSASEEMRADKKQKAIWPFLDRLPSAEFYPLGDPVWVPVSAHVKNEIGRAVAQDPASVLHNLQKYAEEQASAAKAKG